MMRIARKDIFRRTLWFHNRAQFELRDLYEFLRPQRTVSDKPRYKSGLYYSEKCARYVQYESGLELRFIGEQLENNDNVLFYFEQPVKLPYWRGKIKAGSYPDYGVYLRSKEFVLVEVKELSEMLGHRVQAKAEGLMEFCHKRGFGLLLTDGRHVPQDLLKGKVNRTLEKEISSAVDGGPVFEKELKEIMKTSQAGTGELYRAVIRLDLKFTPSRFKLERRSQSPVYRQVYFGRRKYEELTEENINNWF